MEIAAILLLGLAIGTMAGWFFRSRAAEQTEKQLKESREQAAQASRQRDGANRPPIEHRQNKAHR